MKNPQPFLILVGLLMLAVASCKKDPEKPKHPVVFSGRVLDFENGPVKGASVEIGKFKTTTNAEGSFRLATDSSSRYVVNIRKKKFALTSRIHQAPAQNQEYYLYEATVVEVDPTQQIVVKDTKASRRRGSPANNSNWTKNPFSELPLVMENGKITDFGFSKEMQSAFDYVKKRQVPTQGISVTIPPNSFVREGAGAQAPSGKITVEVSTVDLFSPDGMPGDYSVADANSTADRGYMISFGAGSVTVYDEKSRYRLKDNATAKIRIPLDPAQAARPDPADGAIALYLYNETTGFWEDHGKATLTEDGTAYEGEVTHLSSFNMDIEKTTPACLKVRYRHSQASTDLATYKVEAIARKGANIIQRTKTISETGGCLVRSNGTGLHQLYNLPENQQFCLVFYDNANVPVSIIVPTTSGTYKPGPLPNCTIASCPNTCADEILCDTNAGCDGYNSCNYINFSRITGDLIMGSEKGTAANTAVIRWIYKNHTAATTYEIHPTDPSTGCTDGTPVVPTGAVTERTVNGGYKIKEATIPVPAGTTYYKIKAIVGGSPVAESDCNTANAITW